MEVFYEYLVAMLQSISALFASAPAAVETLMGELAARGDALSYSSFVFAGITGLGGVILAVLGVCSRDFDGLLFVMSFIAFAVAAIVGLLGLSYLSESYAPGYTLLHSVI